VYGFTLNDIEGPGYVPETRAEADALGRELLRFADSPSRLLRLVWPRLVVLRDLIQPFPGSYTAVLRRNYFDNPRAWERFEAELDALAAVGRQHGMCVHVLVHTSLAELNALHPLKEIYGRVEEASLARGMTVTQTLPALKGRRAPELVVSPVDPHPNAAGHRILAQALFEGLAELPASCGLELSSETTAPAR